MTRISLLFAIFSLTIGQCESFAAWMTKDFCDRKLVVDEVIMNQAVVLSAERQIKVFRGSTELKSEIDQYIPGEELSVTLTDMGKSQHVFETSPNARFQNGGCEGTRIAKSPALLTVSNEKDNNPLTIVAGLMCKSEMTRL